MLTRAPTQIHTEFSEMVPPALDLDMSAFADRGVRQKEKKNNGKLYRS